ncbi:1,3-beta-galactosyl-N-acetylhexosamine phosphorylase [Erysipelothrix anatis]|uniref:1,3-beta-galactosyl-N-acetylhexosamine phosphorylase n=1 Tax=Erysipelothrix anatis TaxID=2683713 RepID=UPI00140AA554|nr:1,3-beta-galactosyl-N-acetylhexosamine phosphorylase [Erysipelothrix anatis]
MSETKGRLTLPGEHEFYDETKELMRRWGADAIRDSDGTKLEERVKDLDAKIYTTYFVARNYNEFALQHLDETQQIFVMSERTIATSTHITIEILKGFFTEQIQPNTLEDPKEWWQVHNRTTGELLPVDAWTYDAATQSVTINNVQPFHEYTVNFLAFVMWDPTQMYNHLTNNWGDVPKDIPFDARGPKSWEFMKATLQTWLENNPKTDVVRFTTFFYHFTLFFNDMKKDKFVDWFGYGASVSPAALKAFEAEHGYRLLAEDFIQAGTYNSTFNEPTQRYLDYIDFQQRFVASRAKELVDMVHAHGKEAMMFLGDNWIGTEPYGDYFASIGLDAVVGSVGGGASLRVIADIPHVKYTEGRFLPYFFPDTFREGNDPVIEASDNWLRARRAIMRKPVNRIGYGGYPSLAYQFPKFVDYVERIADQFRDIIENIEDVKPHANLTVGILNSWGRLRTWQAFMVAHELWYKQTYSFYGMMDALSGMSVDVKFINFDDVKQGALADIDVVINAGQAGTAMSGGSNWNDPEVVSIIRQWVHEGHGFVGVGEPSAYDKSGKFFQLADILGVERERGLTLSSNKYFYTAMEKHFITEDKTQPFESGEPVTNIYATHKETEVIDIQDQNVTIAANQYGRGRGVYLSGLPYSSENARILYRSLFYAAGKETELHRWFSTNFNCEVNVYPAIGKVAIINNTADEQRTTVYDGNGNAHSMILRSEELRWEVLDENSIII